MSICNIDNKFYEIKKMNISGNVLITHNTFADKLTVWPNWLHFVIHSSEWYLSMPFEDYRGWRADGFDLSMYIK